MKLKTSKIMFDSIRLTVLTICDSAGGRVGLVPVVMKVSTVVGRVYHNAARVQVDQNQTIIRQVRTQLYISLLADGATIRRIMMLPTSYDSTRDSTEDKSHLSNVTPSFSID